MAAEGRGFDHDLDRDAEARIAELRRRLYSRDSAGDPERAASDRQLLDELEAARAATTTDEATADAAVHPSTSEVDRPPMRGRVGDADATPARRRPLRTLLIIASVIVATLGAVAVTWVVVTAPPSADALAIFDDPGTPSDTSPFPPDYRLAGGSEIDDLRSLGTFGGWAAWATLMDDGQVCLIAVQQTTTAATCATRDQFARTGLTLGLAGGEGNTTGNTAPQRDFDITWGPDNPEATTADNSR